MISGLNLPHHIAHCIKNFVFKVTVFLLNPLSLLGYAGERSRLAYATGISIALIPFGISFAHLALGNRYIATFCFAISISALLSLLSGLAFRDRPTLTLRLLAIVTFLASYTPILLSLAPASEEAMRIYGDVSLF